MSKITFQNNGVLLASGQLILQKPTPTCAIPGVDPAILGGASFATPAATRIRDLAVKTEAAAQIGRRFACSVESQANIAGGALPWSSAWQNTKRGTYL